MPLGHELVNQGGKLLHAIDWVLQKRDAGVERRLQQPRLRRDCGRPAGLLVISRGRGAHDLAQFVQHDPGLSNVTSIEVGPGQAG